MFGQKHFVLTFGLLVALTLIVGAVSVEVAVAPMPTGTSSVYMADMNADGALDVLSASEDRDAIAWHRNENATFPSRTPINERAGGIQSIFAEDLDGDGDPDVLSASRKGNQITWHSNDIEEGSGFSGAQPIVRRLADAN